ncbi:DNA cytosine methyltransferase [Nocardioides sp. CPCC 205120]|uniref:DNA cytosine methyltransferase n=1 Tax=Nocardioides sp. CPCC 205120 TaxID=3406462 RepID=UPI003B506BE5
MLDLFAGAGGLSAGLRMGDSRFGTARAVESDLEAAASYAANFGDNVVYAGTIEDWLLHEEVPQVDLVVGGPPCQGFSQLGKRDVDDVRNTLWQQYVETVSLARPKAFVMENVPQFLKSPQFPIFAAAFERGGRLQDFRFEAAVLNAAAYGAPQARRRVVVVGVRRDVGLPSLPSPPMLTPAMTVREAFAGPAGFRPIPEHVPAMAVDLPDTSMSFGGRVLRGPYAASELHFARSYTELSLRRFAAIPPGGNRFDLPDELQAPCWRKHRSGAGDVMGRLSWDKPSVTIRTEFFKPEKGRYLHPTQPRAITHFEAARLQGFADHHEFVGSKTAIARQIGNAVPLALGAALGAHLGPIIS